MNRTILHSDLNNFYASVACKLNPEYKNIPIAVCGSTEKRHGIVLAKNYLAKAYGIITGEASWEAQKKCPNLTIVPPTFEEYLLHSNQVRNIYRQYTNLIEPFGIDECWLDVTGSYNLFGNGESIAYEIKNQIKKEIGITASIGVSFNKIFAKLGSDYKKPDAVTVITKENFPQIVWPLPVEDLLYVGKATKKKLNKIGIFTIGHLANMPYNYISNYLGKYGQTLWFFANGKDTSIVKEDGYESVIKGIGNSTTTHRDICSYEDVKAVFYYLSDSVAKRMRKHQVKGRTVQINLRDTSLMSITRQGYLDLHTFSSYDIAEKALAIFRENWSFPHPIRSLGIRVTSLVSASGIYQPTIWGLTRQQKRECIDLSLDSIRERYGYYKIRRAILLKNDLTSGNPEQDHVIHPLSYFR